MSTSPRKALLLTLPLILSAAVVHAQEAQDAGALVRQADGELDTDLDAAIFDYTAAIRLDASIPEAFHGRGWARLKKGELDGAIKDLTDALRLRPGFVKALLTRADAYEQKLDFVAAITDLDELVRLEPASSDFRRRLGKSKYLKGDLDGAIGEFTAALELDRRNIYALMGRAYVRDLKGDFEGAIADYSEAICVDPGSATAYSYRGLTKAHARDTAGAFADYTEAIKLGPDADTYFRRGHLSLLGGDLEKAIADLTEAIRLKPNIAEAYDERAAASYRAGDDDGAIWDYGESIRMGPTPDALRWRSSAHAFKGSCAEALADAERALELFPKDWRSYDARAKVRALTGDRKNALSDFMTAAELGKDQLHPRIWILALGGNTPPDLTDVVTAQQGEWYWSAIRFLVGTIEASELLDDAGGKSDKLCVARWAIALKAELNDDVTRAKENYEACVATKQTRFYEWRWARARLRLLAREEAGPAVNASDGWKWDPRTVSINHVGDRARALGEETRKVVQMTTTGGTVTGRYEEEMTFRLLATTEIVAVDSNMSTTETLVRVHRWKLVKGQKADTSLEGHVIRLKREGTEHVCSFEDDKEGRISPEAKEWAERELGDKSMKGELEHGEDAGNTNPTLPKEPVGDGAQWKLDLAGLKKHEGWDPERSSGTGTLTGVRCRGGIHYGRIERKLSIARTDFPWKNGGIATMTAETNGSLEPDKDCTSESSMELRFEDLAETVIPGQGLVELRESTELTGWHKVWPVQPDGK